MSATLETRSQDALVLPTGQRLALACGNSLPIDERGELTAEARHLDIPVSHFSYDSDNHLKKIDNRDFRRRAHDIPSVNILTIFLLDPDLRPLIRAAGKIFLLRMFAWHAAKAGMMLLGRK